ncbi:alpha/beta fold hydrolase [Caulobacter sp. CCG-8]|uniref:alpha/beta hydrolase family protein n=1 Tax=Caulobacter sp. CCG-8 TaxID=3127958 RepID=UPI00307ED410
MISRRRILAGAAASPLAAMAGGATAQAPTPPTLEEILAPPTLLGAALSPDGRQLACLRMERKGELMKAYVLLQPADRPRDPPTVVLIGDYDVQRLEWANNERLLIWVLIHKNLDGSPTGQTYGELFFPSPQIRVLSVSLDGADSAVLFGKEGGPVSRAADLGSIVDLLVDDPKNVLMQAWDYDKGCLLLYKVDIYTGEAVFFERGAQETYGWLTQNGLPVIRLDTNRRGNIVWIYTRPPGQTRWTLYRKLRRNELEQISDFNVVGATAEAGVMLVTTQHERGGDRVLQRFDLQTLQLGEVLASRSDRDIDSVVMDERGGLLAASFTDDREDYVFFDQALKAHYRGLQSYFKNDVNLGFIDVSLDHNRFVISASSPTRPGSLWLYDKPAGALTPLGEMRPWLTGRLAPTTILKLKSRDGLDLTAYLTTPLNAAVGPRPLVIFPHGGPEARDAYGFDQFVQAFAARGWYVLQVNFRGSSGYGKAFADAGRKRWGEEMQNDIEDALVAVVAKGGIDQGRIAICGASYGGYAALMGAVKTPKVYRAVVSIAGVSDLPEMVAYTRREDGGDSLVYAYVVETIGDPVADKALLERSSPAFRAKEITAPVMLIHGVHDGVVPIEQSNRMAKALKAAGNPAKRLDIKWVGHRGWDGFTTKTILSAAITHIETAFNTAQA